MDSSGRQKVAFKVRSGVFIEMFTSQKFMEANSALQLQLQTARVE